MLPKTILTALLLSSTASAALFAGQITWSFKTDKPAIDYQVGEEATVTIQLLDDGQPAKNLCVRWSRTGDDGQKASGTANPGETAVIKTAVTVPGYARIDAVALEADGKTRYQVETLDRKNNQKKMKDFKNYIGGIGAGFDEITGGPAPADFDEFWAKQLELLKTVPMKTLEMKEIKHKKDNMKCYDVKVACYGKRPVSGYLVMPADAKEKSLPLLVNYKWYSVTGADIPAGRNDCIEFYTNAHGILNGQPFAYYKELNAGELKGYGFHGNDKPEETYFRDMLLRAVRAAEFGMSLKEWNGKDFTVSGSSQGGFQALCVAGLVPQITKINADEPWLCNLSGSAKQNRHQSFFRPKYTPALEYFDPVNFAKNIKGELVLTVGLRDYVCPPSGTTSLYNAVKSAKQVVWAQGRDHGEGPAKDAAIVKRSAPASAVQ